MNKKRNDELASARLQQSSQEWQRRLARYAAMTEEELESAHLRKAGEERQRRLARDAAMNEA